MSVRSNPWVSNPATRQGISARGSGHAEADPCHIPKPRTRIGVTPAAEGVEVHVLGAGGGSAESSIAALHPAWRATQHRWPAPPSSASAYCLLTARSSASGLVQVRDALALHAGGHAPAGIKILGVVVVADAPGRLPRPLSDLLGVCTSAAPQVWRVPWIEAWRLGDTHGDHRSTSRLVADVTALIAAANPLQNPLRKAN